MGPISRSHAMKKYPCHERIIMKINNKHIRLALIALIFVVYWIFSPYLKDIQDSVNDPAVSEIYVENVEGLQSDAAQGSSVLDSPEGQAISSSEHAVISPFSEGFSLDDIPPYSGEAYTFINDNVPFFSDEYMQAEPYESFSELDELGRCGPAMAMLHESLMPSGERGDISEIKPTGWRQNFYDFVEGEAIYNRSHLIGYQLTGQNANPENLITGTRTMNADAMRPFEEDLAWYLRDSGDKVLYRVTPVFYGDELLARGVLMEARSEEEGSDGMEFCIYCYNVQPGVVIDYETGKNHLDDAYWED